MLGFNALGALPLGDDGDEQETGVIVTAGGTIKAGIGGNTRLLASAHGNTRIKSTSTASTLIKAH